MASVQLQSLSITSGNTAGNYPIILQGVWSDIISYGPVILVSTNSLNIGGTYTIVNLGTTTTIEWHILGVPPAVTPAIGVSFTAITTSAGSGTGQVQQSFATPYEVKFGAVSATLVTVLNNNQISCIVPAVSQSLVDVTLTNLTVGVTSLLPSSFTFLNDGDSTLGTIRREAQQRTDMVNSNFISTEEWNAYINASYYELYDILVQKFGDDYFVARPYTYTTGSNQTLYPLPVNFYKLLGVEVQLNTGNPDSWVTLKKFQFIDRNRWSYPNVYTFYGITNLRYRVNGNNLMIVPIGQAGQTVRIWYVPRQRLLINDGSIVDGVSGWEEYIIVDACIKAWNKQESDTSVFMAQKQALLKRIEEAAENRDPGEADHVSDSKSLNYGWGAGSDGNGNNGSLSGW